MKKVLKNINCVWVGRNSAAFFIVISNVYSTRKAIIFERKGFVSTTEKISLH